MSGKKLTIILISTIMAVIVIDIALNSFISRYMKNHSLPGDYEKIDYIMKKCDAPFILMGASQCANFFMPDLMEEQLHTGVFNCGVNAQTLEFFDVMLDGMIRRVPPKQVLLVLRSSDLTSPSLERLTMMNIYYGQYSTLLDNYLDSGSIFLKLRYGSSLLRLNTQWWRILLYHFISFNEMKNKGFIAKEVRDLHPKTKIKLDESALVNVKEILPKKKVVLDHIVQNCKQHHIKLYISLVPTMTDYGTVGNVHAKLLQEYCQANDILLFDDSQLTEITDRPELFYDEFHLNADGAKVYTKLFMEKYYDKLLPFSEN